MLISPSQKRVDKPLSRVPPRYKYWPSGANKATPEKQAKIIEDKRRAFGTIAGFIRIAMFRRGPIPSPEKKAKPSSIDSLRPRFLPLSGVKKRPKANPAPNSANPICKIKIILVRVAVR